MNRAEKRRLEREKEKNNVRYNFTRKEVKEIIVDETQKNLMDVLNKYALIFAFSLHNEYGFGKKRLANVLNKSLKNFECVGSNHLEYDDVIEWAEEIGLEIE